MDRPVAAWWFSELTCAVERVDDPHALGSKPRRVIATFFGQDRIPGRDARGEAFHEQEMRLTVTLVFERLGIGAFAHQAYPEIDEKLAGLFGERRSE